MSHSGAAQKTSKPVAKGGPESADIDAGIRLRMRRTEMNMSQQTLGEQVGVTFQQIQKYEKGTNRISASKLKRFAEILRVPPAYFFDAIPLSAARTVAGGFSGGGQAALEDAPNGNTATQQLDASIFQRPETFDLLRAYFAITDARQRRKVLDTVKAMASMATDAK